MLKPEQAQVRLQEWKSDDRDESEWFPAIRKLPSPLKTSGFLIFQRNKDGDEIDYSSSEDSFQAGYADRYREIGKLLDAMSTKDRTRLFAVFFPKFPAAVEAAWNFLKQAPYQSGYARKSFRAPNHPEASRQFRGDWLCDLVESVKPYRSDIVTLPWLAAWSPHIDESYGNGQTVHGRLFAAVIEAGGKEGDELLDILAASTKNEHEVGAFGRHVTRALLMSSRREGWELMEKTLLAAQRQEGLRQAILETVDECHPEAFRRMLRLVVDQGLARFSAVARAANVWFGLSWDSASVKVVNDTIEQALKYLDDDKARAKALAGKDPEQAFLALWATAFEDAFESLGQATKLLKHKQVEMRYVAATHLAQLALPQAHGPRMEAMDDPDLRVALCAVLGAPTGSEEEEPNEIEGGEDVFERLERLYQRMPEKPITLKALVWPWTEMKAKRDEVAWRLLDALGKRPPTRMLPYLKALHQWHRTQVIELLAKQKKWDQVTRSTLLELAGDGSAEVRGASIGALSKVTLTAAEVQQLESYLNRKASDLRSGVIKLLLKQKDSESLASADRLTASKDGSQRLAGLELLRHLAVEDRQREACQTRATAYAASRKKLTKEEETQLAAIATSDQEVITLDNGLGLLNPDKRSPAAQPRKLKVEFITPAAVACLKGLDDLIHQHRETPIKVKMHDGEKEELLGAVTWGFPSPPVQETARVERRRRQVGAKQKQEQEPLPLKEVWLQWWEQRPKTLRDKDGLELVRALVWSDVAIEDWEFDDWRDFAKKSAQHKKLAQAISGGQGQVKVRYDRVVIEVLKWLLHLKPPAGAVDYLLDAIESSWALIPDEIMQKLPRPKPDGEEDDDSEEENDWREMIPFHLFLKQFDHYDHAGRWQLTPQQQSRLWKLYRWRDEPFPGAMRGRPDVDVVLEAYSGGAATLDDIADHLLGPQRGGGYGGASFDMLQRLAERKPIESAAELLEKHPEVADLVRRARDRILEIELARGDAATAASDAALALPALWGTNTLVRILTVIGNAGFKVESSYRADRLRGRLNTLTSLAKSVFPLPSETAEDFSKAMKAAIAAGHFPEARLLQLAFLAPQWAKFLEDTLRWDGLTEGIYWFLAHMRYVWGATELAASGEDGGDETPADEEDDSDDGDGDKVSSWERLIQQRTPLTEEERFQGAIDVVWFRRTFDQLGDKRWEALAEAARFAANSSQAKRAGFIADVLLGKANRKDLFAGVRTKKLKEYVRLLGLLPLAAGAKREADLTERYKALQEYKRYAKQLSAMTKEDALRAVEIGLRNLASTAGYTDPLRLEWALEAESVKDLAKGPISAAKDGVTITLALDENGKPDVTIRKGDKELKSAPPPVKKDKKVAALLERATELKRSASRIKQSLETAMCRGDEFTGEELVSIFAHPLLAPVLARLVLVGEGIAGYPDKGGKTLRNQAGKHEPLKKTEKLRIAHPHDLLTGGQWEAWQHECFEAERLQPFKQVFREVYVVTKQEKSDGAASRRYAGQQVNEKQALALFGQRGWRTKEGVEKTYYDLGINVQVEFQHGVTTPLEVEGLTLDTVRFYHRDQREPLALVKVPPRVFSEVMRDLDLVVSVAHRGSVDPEASASTVEMRASLLRETCSLLKLDNVRLKNAHALIDGELANYSIHLGSGVVHKLPGGSLCIVPVHAQHRGRLFLPFADDDPRTAEVISKTLLLARDSEIQDPTILDQLRAQ